jgi:hypothetical protein
MSGTTKPKKPRAAQAASVLCVDIRTRPVGSFYGGSAGRSVRCLVCGMPAIALSTTKSGRERFVHVLEFSLNKKNDPIMTHGTRCVTEPATPPKARSRRKRKPRLDTAPANDNAATGKRRRSA